MQKIMQFLHIYFPYSTYHINRQWIFLQITPGHEL